MVTLRISERKFALQDGMWFRRNSRKLGRASGELLKLNSFDSAATAAVVDGIVHWLARTGVSLGLKLGRTDGERREQHRAIAAGRNRFSATTLSVGWLDGAARLSALEDRPTFTDRVTGMTHTE